MQIYSDKIFKNPIKVIEAFDNKTFEEAFSQIEIYKENFYLVGYIRYEAKDIFLGKTVSSRLPFLYFEVYDRYETYEPNSSFAEMFLNPIPQIHFSEYKLALDKIKEYIALGDTYQVNYTYEHLVKCPDSIDNSLEFYEKILQNQKTPYNAFIKNKYEEILSFSPELFFEIEDNKIRTKPMKGTVKRGLTEEEDSKNIEFLKADIKNRAENVMIVDLLRNDLGKIAKTGTVNVDKLFDVETHKTVHQMTSEVEAELLDNIVLYDIFKAIFPCGSITGAPKISTMKIIEELEKGKRDIYCGAIGLISKEKTVFSVPIRILHKENNQSMYRLRVGGAIVWDSDVEDEWDETKTKIKFLNPVEDFDIVETVKVDNLKSVDYSEHIDRMKQSADSLGFTFNNEIYSIYPVQNGIMRIRLSKSGRYSVEYKPLEEPLSYSVRLSDSVMDSDNPYLRHKTTFRPWYQNSYEKITSGELYDEIFVNEKGELTEGSRTNILLEIGSKLYTPPLSSGLLNGVLRQKMIDSGQCKERILKLSDLSLAENIYCINSVRGMQRVRLDDFNR